MNSTKTTEQVKQMRYQRIEEGTCEQTRRLQIIWINITGF